MGNIPYEKIEKLIVEAQLDDAVKMIDKLDPSLANRLDLEIYRCQIYLQKGEFQEANELAIEVLTNARLYGYDEIVTKALIEHAFAEYRLGNISHAREIIGEAEKNIDSNQISFHFKKTLSRLYNVKGIILRNQGELLPAFEAYNESLSYASTVKDEVTLGRLYNNMANILYYENRLDEAIDYYMKSLNLRQKLKDISGIAMTYHNMANLYLRRGHFDESLGYFNQSLKYKNKIGNESSIALTHSDIAELYLQKGEIDEAKLHLEKSHKIREKVGNRREIALSNLNRAYLEKSKNNTDEAIRLLEHALEDFRSVGNEFEITKTLTSLYSISMENNRQEQAEIYLNQLESYVNDDSPPIQQHRYKLAQAIRNQYSQRLANIAEAQEILEELLEDPSLTDNEIHISVIKHLVELYLLEIKLFDNADLLDTVQVLIDRLLRLARKQNSFSLTISSLIIKSKLFVLMGEIERAIIVLEQAEINAIEKNLKQFIRIIHQEKQEMENEIKRWDNLSKMNTPLFERVEQSKIIDYLRETHRKLFKV